MMGTRKTQRGESYRGTAGNLPLILMLGGSEDSTDPATVFAKSFPHTTCIPFIRILTTFLTLGYVYPMSISSFLGAWSDKYLA